MTTHGPQKYHRSGLRSGYDMMNTEKHEKSMNAKSILPAILACLAWQTVAPVRAVPRPGDEPTAGASRTGDVIILPLAFYSPETKIAGGLGGLLTFRPSRAGAAERPSSIYFYAIYTQLKQFSMSWEPEFYSRQETWLVKGRLLLERYPDKFWGIGLVGFAGLGNVAPRPWALELDQLKYSYGAGLRYRVRPREATNIRMDVAFGQGTSGLYFTAREAF